MEHRPMAKGRVTQHSVLPQVTKNIIKLVNGEIGIGDLTTYEKGQLSNLVGMIKKEQLSDLVGMLGKEQLSDLTGMLGGTKWECKSGDCGHEWREFDPFITPGDCPKCGHDYVEHY